MKENSIRALEELLRRLWEANPEIHTILQTSASVEHAREALYAYLSRVERALFDQDTPLHVLDHATVRDGVRVLRSIIGPINEKRANTSALRILWKLATHQCDVEDSGVELGFINEFFYLFRLIAGHSEIYQTLQGHLDFLELEGREAALKRSDRLDELAAKVHRAMKRYPSGLEQRVIERRIQNRTRILEYFHATENDWWNYTWHLKHVIHTPEVLSDMINVSNELLAAIRKAVENNIPFGISPFYLSLMDQDPTLGLDHAVRAQVIPPPSYIDELVACYKDRKTSFDFMGEHDTSPVDLVTRRYPLICIIKPYNSCAQICVYCQRNWEIQGCLSENAAASQEDIDRALDWISDHPGLGDILVTGGDPMVMEERGLARILDRLAAMEHVYRIRIGTRTPVVLPMRWTDNVVKLLAKYHEPQRREVAVVTHFEHSYEITPEACDAVQKIRKQGIGVYNQEVFTVENSRRFESAKLRKDLRLIGVDPYYNFNMKGKKETKDYMVPIARILQERKEEARLLPGLDRTDEPVFNVPKLGKNHVRALQDHQIIMIMPDGSRIYEFHPWEKYIDLMPAYYYEDVSIYEYLNILAARGEDVDLYKTIWYYY